LLSLRPGNHFEGAGVASPVSPIRSWVVACAAVLLSGSARAQTAEKPPTEAARLAKARQNVGQKVRGHFARVQLAYPPAEIFLRAIKDEGLLELWAAPAPGQAMVQVKAFKVCMRSGGPGPKRARGDGQVPEGFYRVDRFNPWSTFHLSLGLDYPNQSDRLRKTADNPGGDIFIHGGCVTIGCLPLEDGPMEELFVIATDARANGQRGLPVHLFPSRLDVRRLEALEEKGPAEHLDFWRELAPGYQAFESTRRPPRVRVDPRTGAYRLRAVPAVSARATATHAREAAAP